MVGGIDHTPYMAELEAAARVIKATGGVECDLDLVIDNQAVVRGLDDLWSGRARLPKHAWKQWVDI